MHNLNIVHGDLKGVCGFLATSFDRLTFPFSKANILINRSLRACIADFGLSAMTRSGALTNDAASFISQYSLAPFTLGGTYRWMSPELLFPENFGITDDRPTRQSDCFALGMVIYEVCCSYSAAIPRPGLNYPQVLSGHVPYRKLSSRLAMNEIIEGRRPKKPKLATRLGFTKELREVLEWCWLEDRNRRPNLGVVLSTLNNTAPF